MENRRRANTEEFYRGTQREMEVNSFAGVVTAFRSQGELTDEKRTILKQLQSIFNISTERYGAEMRRVAYDDFLNRLAFQRSGIYHSEMSWVREGKRIISLIPRAPPETVYWAFANETLRRHIMGTLETTTVRSRIVDGDTEFSITTNEDSVQNGNQALANHFERHDQNSGAASTSSDHFNASSARLQPSTSSAAPAADYDVTVAASTSSSSAELSRQNMNEDVESSNKVKGTTVQAAADALQYRKLESRVQTMSDDDDADDDEMETSNTNSQPLDTENRTFEALDGESSPNAGSTQRSELSDDRALRISFDGGDSNSTLMGVPSLSSSEVVENGVIVENYDSDYDDDNEEESGNRRDGEQNLASPAHSSSDSSDDENDSIRLYESNSSSSSFGDSSDSSDDEGGGGAVVNNHNNHNPESHHNPRIHHNPGRHHNPGSHNPSNLNPENRNACTNNPHNSNSEESNSSSTNNSDSNLTIVNISDNSNENNRKVQVQSKLKPVNPSNSTPVPSQTLSVAQKQEEKSFSNLSMEFSNSLEENNELTEIDDTLSATEIDSFPGTEVLEESTTTVSNIQESTSIVNSTPGTSSAQVAKCVPGPPKICIQDQSNLLKTAKVVSTGSGNSKHIIVVQKGGAQSAARTVALSSANKELLNKVLAGKNISQTNINCPVVSVQKAGAMLKSCGNVSFRGNQGSVILLDVSREHASSMSIAEILQASGVLGEKKIVKIGTDDAVNSVKPNTKITQLSSAATVMLTNPTTTGLSKDKKPYDNVDSINQFPTADSCPRSNNTNRLEQDSSSTTVSESKEQPDCRDNEQLVPTMSRTTDEQGNNNPVFPQIETNSEIICDNTVDSENTNSIADPSSPERETGYEEIPEEQLHDNVMETEKIMYEYENSNDTIPVTINFEKDFLVDCDNSSFSEKRKHSESEESNVKIIKIINDTMSTEQANDGALRIPTTSQLNSIQKDCDIMDLDCSTVENDNSGSIVISMESDNLTDSIASST